MRYKTFKATFFKGFEKVGAGNIITMDPNGKTIEEMQEYCRLKFIGRKTILVGQGQK